MLLCKHGQFCSVSYCLTLLQLILHTQEKVMVYRDGAEFKSNYNYVFSEQTQQTEVYEQVRCECVRVSFFFPALT